MTGYIIIDDGTDRARWLDARRRGVSATDAARIMTGGAGTWGSLRREKETGESWRGNAYTQHGREREAAIAAWAQHEFALVPSTALIARNTPVVPEGSFALDLATPDALGIAPIGGESDLTIGIFGEYKTTVHDWPTWGDVPKRYHWQVVWQFWVTGADRCYFVFEPHEDFVPLYMEPRVFVIERAEVLDDIEHAVAAVAEWRADGDVVPDGLKALDGLLSRRAQAKEEVEAATGRVAVLDAEIRTLLVEHGRPVKFEGSGANVTWTGKPVTGTRFDASAFKAADPERYAEFIKTTESQPRLTITARS